MKIVKLIFWLVCIILTFLNIKKCFDSFFLDESFSNTEYVDYLTYNSSYPAISICLVKPFLRDNLELFNTTYSEYVRPRTNELSFLYTIPYENVTLSEENGSIKLSSSVRIKDEKIKELRMKSNPSMRSSNLKCFTTESENIREHIDMLQMR